MKKLALRTIMMLQVLLVPTAVSVHAQSERTRINIPFNFVVGQKTLPAGEYTLEPSRKDSVKVWLVEGRVSRANAFFATSPVWTIETQKKSKLVFRKYGDQYFLSQIWTVGDNTGRELLTPNLERQMAKNAVKREMIIVAGSDN